MRSVAKPAPEERTDPVFRLDNEQLAFRFTATLSDRHGHEIERLPSVQRLEDWLVENRLTVPGEHAAAAELSLAHRLREAIHRIGTAVSRGESPADGDRQLLNAVLADEQSYAELAEGGLRWHSRAGRPVAGALGRIAQDAAMLLGGPERTRVKTCENPDCRGLYVDTSQGRNRRWCSMNICGNRAKKARYRAPRSTAA